MLKTPQHSKPCPTRHHQCLVGVPQGSKVPWIFAPGEKGEKWESLHPHLGQVSPILTLRLSQTPSMLWEGEEGKTFQPAVPNWTPVPILDPSHSKAALAEAEQTAAFPGSVSQRVQPARIYQSLPLPDVRALRGSALLRSWGCWSLGLSLQMEITSSVCKP